MPSQELSADELVYPEEYLVRKAEAKPGRGAAFAKLQEYLLNVIRWQFRAEKWEIIGNLGLYFSEDYDSEPEATPHVLVFKGIRLNQDEWNTLAGYTVKLLTDPRRR
jgi:hypothetical protein